MNSRGEGGEGGGEPEVQFGGGGDGRKGWAMPVSEGVCQAERVGFLTGSSRLVVMGGGRLEGE